MSQSLLPHPVRASSWSGAPGSSTNRWILDGNYRELEFLIQEFKKISREVQRGQSHGQEVEELLKRYGEREDELVARISVLRSGSGGSKTVGSGGLSEDLGFENVEGREEIVEVLGRWGSGSGGLEDSKQELGSLEKELEEIRLLAEKETASLGTINRDVQALLVEQSNLLDQIRDGKKNLEASEVDESILKSDDLDQQRRSLNAELQRIKRIVQNFSTMEPLGWEPRVEPRTSRPRIAQVPRGSRSLPKEISKFEPAFDYDFRGANKDVSQEHGKNPMRKRQKRIAEELCRLEAERDTLDVEAEGAQDLLESALSLAEHSGRTNHKQALLPQVYFSHASVFDSPDDRQPQVAERNGSTGSTSTHSDVLSDASLDEADKASVSSAAKRLDFEDAVVVPRTNSLVDQALDDRTSSNASEELVEDGIKTGGHDEVETDVGIGSGATDDTGVGGETASNKYCVSGTTRVEEIQGGAGSTGGYTRTVYQDLELDADEAVESGDEAESKISDEKHAEVAPSYRHTQRIDLENNEAVRNLEKGPQRNNERSLIGKGDSLKVANENDLPELSTRRSGGDSILGTRSQLTGVLRQVDEQRRVPDKKNSDLQPRQGLDGTEELNQPGHAFFSEISDLKKKVNQMQTSFFQDGGGRPPAGQLVEGLHDICSDQSTKLKDLEKQINFLAEEVKEQQCGRTELEGKLDNEYQERLKVEAKLMDLSESVAHNVVTSKGNVEDETVAGLLELQKTLVVDQLKEAEKLRDVTEFRTITLVKQAEQLELLCDSMQDIREVLGYQDRAYKFGLQTFVQVLMLSIGIFTVLNRLSEPICGSLVPT